jgi:hypothetical protein
MRTYCMIKKIGILFTLLWSSTATAQAESNNGDVYWGSITCGGVKADLMINHRTVAQPTLFLNGKAILLKDGPDYSGPKCVTFRGEKKVGFVESMGNAYEIYRIVDLDTFKVREITYQQAIKIGF